jgi:eukaryotic-like serine/threonine-protein kinase
VQLSPGDTFDRYTIEILLGEGGMGSVYRAYDARLERRVALKILRTGEARSDAKNASEGAARLLREARVAAALDHPNAVAIYDVGQAGDAPFIAMELIEGVSLRARIGDPAVSWDTRTRWLLDIARVLAAAHKRGLIHRDVKPENVMIRHDGVLKVLDFGIARRPKLTGTPGGEYATLTEKGNVVGTPLYMAPEQLKGEPNLDGRADQFSWGVVAYELFTGRLPWDGGGDAIVAIAEMLTKDPAPMTCRGLPGIVQAAVLKALSISPANRFRSMDEVVLALEPFGSPSSRNVAGEGAHDSTLPPPAFDTNTPEPSARIPMPPPPIPKTVMTAAVEPAKRPAKRSAPLLAGAVLAAAVAGAAVWWGSRTAPTSVPATASSASALREEQTPRDAERTPKTSSADALAEYRAGVQAYRDGADGATRHFYRAVELDPQFAAALLRVALYDLLPSPTKAREAYQRATELRSMLDDHDRTWLEAAEPWVRQPSDPKEYVRRLRAALTRFPDDIDFSTEIGVTLMLNSDYTPALEALESALAADPKYARAWWYKGQTQAYLGDLEGANRSLDRCLELAPSATNCIWNRVAVFEVEGQCAKDEADARRWIGIDRKDPLAYDALAGALVSQGRPLETIREVLREKWDELDDADRKQVSLVDTLHLELLAGDFAGVDRTGRELEEVVASDKTQAAHGRPARARVEALLEAGDPAKAAAVADDFLKRSDAWMPDAVVEDFSIANDPMPTMLDAERAGGKMKAWEIQSRREAWLNRLLPELEDNERGYVWIAGYAAPARTSDDAAHALDVLPRLAPLPPFAPKTIAEASIGNVYFLAGRMDEAAPLVERGAATCLAFERPVDHVHAQLLLGTVREARGDRQGACAAYAAVLARWGDARPRSVTADRARARQKALGCAR